jgi:hypothetical protein
VIDRCSDVKLALQKTLTVKFTEVLNLCLFEPLLHADVVTLHIPKVFALNEKEVPHATLICSVLELRKKKSKPTQLHVSQPQEPAICTEVQLPQTKRSRNSLAIHDRSRSPYMTKPST